MPFASLSDITHGELFAGIAGFSLGFEKSGIKTLWHVEIDENCRSVLNKHYPGSLILSDIRDVGRHNLPFVNIISFGSPCQGLSVAGKRKGFNDDRSNLFFEAIRVVDELKPDFAVWENVPGALSSNSGRDFATALSEFRRIGARDIAWRIIDAQYCGVAQRRRRVLLVADFRGERAAEILFESESGPWDTPPRRKTRAEAAGAITPDAHPGSYNGAGAITPDAHPGSYNGQDAYTGNLIAFAPQAGGKTGLNINENLSGTLQENQVMAVAYSVRPRSGMPQGWNTNLVAFGGNNTQGEVSVATACNAHGSGRYDFESETFITGPLANASGQRGWHVSAEDAASGKILPTGEGVRRLTPLECERLQLRKIPPVG
jgi:DNA (cytosine-5)-methyltransferase 1